MSKKKGGRLEAGWWLNEEGRIWYNPPLWLHFAKTHGLPDGETINGAELHFIDALANRMPIEEGKDTYNLSNADISYVTRLSDKSIFRASNHLVRCGLITKKYNGRYKKNEYGYLPTPAYYDKFITKDSDKTINNSNSDRTLKADQSSSDRTLKADQSSDADVRSLPPKQERSDIFGSSDRTLVSDPIETLIETSLKAIYICDPIKEEEQHRQQKTKRLFAEFVKHYKIYHKLDYKRAEPTSTDKKIMSEAITKMEANGVSEFWLLPRWYFKIDDSGKNKCGTGLTTICGICNNENSFVVDFISEQAAKVAKQAAKVANKAKVEEMNSKRPLMIKRMESNQNETFIPEELKSRIKKLLSKMNHPKNCYQIFISDYADAEADIAAWKVLASVSSSQAGWIKNCTAVYYNDQNIFEMTPEELQAAFNKTDIDLNDALLIEGYCDRRRNNSRVILNKNYQPTL